MASTTQGAMRVLTVHFNTPELTARLVRNMPKQTPRGRPVFVHVLDNCSTPENFMTLRADIEGLRGVTLEASHVNLGFGEGINVLARKHCQDESDILWLLNPDTQLRAGCVEQLENELDSGNFAVISPLIYSGESGKRWIWYCGGTISTRDLAVRHPLYGGDLSEAPTGCFETELVTGAAPMMRASTFRAVGGLPPGYFLYWEDTYFSYKARSLGFRLGVVPSAQIWHAVGASSGSGQSQTFYYWFARNRFLFAQDIGLPRRRLLVGRGGVESIRTVARALLERDGRLLKSAAAIRGTLDGLRINSSGDRL